MSSVNNFFSSPNNSWITAGDSNKNCYERIVQIVKNKILQIRMKILIIEDEIASQPFYSVPSFKLSQDELQKKYRDLQAELKYWEALV